MDLKNLAVQMLMQKLGTNVSQGNATSALTSLLGAGENFDLGNIVSQFSNSGGSAASLLGSWLGDGDNQQMSADQVESVVGAEKLSEFASQLGINSQDAKSGLADLLPSLIDKGSQGGDLLSSGSVQGTLTGLASGLFKT